MTSDDLLRSKSFLVLVSAVLLILCFPPFNLGILSWVALIPFFQAVYITERKREACLTGFFFGVVYFGISLYWMNAVHPAAWILLTFLEALFFILLAGLIYAGMRLKMIGILRIFWLAGSWLAVEFFRSETPIIGLGWNHLSHSQANHLNILQFANVFGTYGLGFLIALVNAILFEFISEARWQLGHGKAKFVQERFLQTELLRPAIFAFGSICLLWACLISYGKKQLEAHEFSHRSVKVSVVQGNIPQDVKWDPDARLKIIQTYNALTEEAAREEPDLIVWPEAAFPGYFNRDYASRRVEDLILRLEIPLLVGSPHYLPIDNAFNSAYLLDEKGHISQRYDKQYLVPFGEYVPLKKIFGVLEPLAYAMGVSNFSAGKKPVLFTLPKLGTPFAALICFEDVFSDLTRRTVNAGASFLTVITNDAWFGDSAAPHQHLQSSILRAVENGVSIARAANTGVSGFIAPNGKVLSRVRNATGRDTYVKGFDALFLPISDEVTVFRKWGWQFPYWMIGFWLALFAIALARVKTERKRALNRQLRAKNKDVKRVHRTAKKMVSKHHVKKTASPGKKKKGSASKKIRGIHILILALILMSGCIRLSGGAYYSGKSEQEGRQEVKGVTFDSNRLLPNAGQQGSLEGI